MNDTQRLLYHELANLLTLTRANVEAMRDDVLSATPQRLERIAGALERASRALDELKKAAS